MSDRGRSAQQQFGRLAELYARSRFHASDETLDIIVGWARSAERALDVGTGAGFTAFAVAPQARLVLAYDPTPEMLQQAVKLAGQREIKNARFIQGTAERLPFPDNSFELYTCRTAAHHFHSLSEALTEAQRVLRPGGQALFMDTISPDDPEADAWQDSVERMRDPSHTRNYSQHEWVAHLAGAGLRVGRMDRHLRTRLTFRDWMERSGAPADVIADLKDWLLSAPPSIRRAFEIAPAGDDVAFSWPSLAVEALKR